ncbi:MAG: autotransporter beta- protein [Alphaproteobacteria bacterium]|nr:autotransporter beta- protein [Alphaproteobacteria bacterium]
MRHLLAASCLTPIALLAAPAAAETLVSTARTIPIATSTANGGSADDVRITSDGSVKPGSGVAVTLDSDNKVTNEGSIQTTDSDGAVGILALPGHTGAISNSGTITIDESYVATDADGDGEVDGPLSTGVSRFGILVFPGAPFAGDITNTGTITVKGNRSAGIEIDAPLTGTLKSSGTVTVTGDDSYGIRAGAVGGNVAISGTITVTGHNDVGVAVDGDIGGALAVQGGITATGYRSTVRPTDTTTLDADDLLQGGPALRISGNVAGGILFDIPPVDADPNNSDEDGDGIPDASEGSALVTSYGAAPAVQIGAVGRDTAIGAVAGTAAAGNGIVVKGAIDGEGVYSGVSATGFAIGGLGGKVDVAGGMLVSGSVNAGSLDSDATALHIGAGATVPTLTVSGRILATGGSVATSNVEGVAIDSGANVASLVNSGSIGARINGAAGIATAIVDHSGTLGSIQNSGTIGTALTSGGTAIAIDLSANSGGAAVSQVAPASTTAAAPVINGAILLGSGNDMLSLSAGSAAGAISFGEGTGTLRLSGAATQSGGISFGSGADTMSLSGTTIHQGDVDFGGGADSLTLSDTASFSGALSRASGLAISVGGGTLDLSNSGTVTIGSLDVAATGAFTISLDGAAGTHTLYDVIGSASFAPGAKVNLKVTSLGAIEGDYTILHAGTLTGASNLVTAGAAIPYLFHTDLSVDQAAGEVDLQVRRKSAAELGLNRSGAAAYDAVYAALTGDTQLASVFLGIQDADTFARDYRQLLPDHAGGVFAMATEGSRALGRTLADPHSPLIDMGGWGFFLQQIGWGSSKPAGDSAPWRVTGWGASGGAEIKAGGLGNIGLSLAYLAGVDRSDANQIDSNEYELAAYWRADWKGLHAYARASGAYLMFDSTRNFSGTAGTTAVARKASGSWNGTMVSGSGGLSYEVKSGRFTIRPAVSVDYYRLHEGSWSESGGGSFDLSIDARTGDSLAANGTVAVGYAIQAAKAPADPYLRVEVEGGRRENAGGSIGATTARFSGGQDFTLLADDARSSWIGRLRLLGGNGDFQASGEVGAERETDRTALSARVAVQMKF